MLNKQYNKITQYTFSCPANDKKAKEQTKKTFRLSVLHKHLSGL